MKLFRLKVYTFWARGYKTFFMSMKFFLLLIVNWMPTIVGILTFLSRKNSILGLYMIYMILNNAEFLDIFYTYEHFTFHAQLSWAWKKFYNLGPWFITVWAKLKEILKQLSIWERCLHGWIDGWMTCDFSSFSTVFQSYQNDGRMKMKINLKEYLQERKLHSKLETWAILRSFGYSSLISDPGMIWWWKPDINIFHTF